MTDLLEPFDAQLQRILIIVLAYCVIVFILGLLREFDQRRLTAKLIKELKEERISAWTEVGQALAFFRWRRLWEVFWAKLFPVHKKWRIHMPSYTMGLFVLWWSRFIAAPLLAYDLITLARDALAIFGPPIAKRLTGEGSN